ncbi:PIN-like domain-containing protein [Homoserinibacter gongjuensis]|nr:PIN-like domain-containing protein [Homoserinibacter gongjuensis]
MPGQTAQEFWNNKVAGLPRVSGDIGSTFASLKGKVEQLDDALGLDMPLAAIEGALQEFEAVHQGLTSTRVNSGLKSLFEMLDRRARFPFVPRDAFLAIGQARYATKTPPGFKDSAPWLGDFFVWADFLLGLASVTSPRQGLVVMVTEDRKSDWEVRGHVHPILAGEVKALTGCRFQLWTVEQLRELVEST